MSDEASNDTEAVVGMVAKRLDGLVPIKVIIEVSRMIRSMDTASPGCGWWGVWVPASGERGAWVTTQAGGILQTPSRNVAEIQAHAINSMGRRIGVTRAYARLLDEVTVEDIGG